MMTKTFDCVEFQRKVRNDLIKESGYDFEKFKSLLKEKIRTSDFVKSFKERNIAKK